MDKKIRKKVGLVLLLASIASIIWLAAVYFNLGFWIAPPNQKFLRSWSEDIQLLENTKNALPKEWHQIREISVKADNSPIQDWLQIKGWEESLKKPIPIDPKNGQFRLEIFLIHWIEGYRYGIVVQYNLVDLRNNNTIWELGRTLKLGAIY